MSVKVIDLDIRQASRIEGLSGYKAVEILFRSGRDPVGRARLPCNGNSVDSDKLQALIADLPKPQPLNITHEKLPTISVAICTQNRPDDLSAALQSLSRQEYSADEILVIDNGCQIEIRNLVADILPTARYIPERRVGLDFARNRATKEATGEIIAFMDDDAEADPFWVKSVAESFAGHPRAGVVTGLTPPIELETPAQVLFESYSGYMRGFTRFNLPRDGKHLLGMRVPLIADTSNAGTGCNMAFKLEVLRELNGFDEAFDTGRPLPGGGDLDMFHRVVRAGYQLVYEPRAIVRHRHRRTEAELVQQLTGHQRSFIALIVKSIFVERGWARFDAILFLAHRFEKAGRRMLLGMLGNSPLSRGLLLRLFGACFTGLGSYHASKRRIRGQTQQHGGAIPKLIFQLSELSRYRELIWNLTARDLKVKYQRSWLGFLWTLMNPLITIGVLVTVFSYVVRIPINHYWAFLISGYFAWNFFSQTLNGGVQAAVGNAYLSRSAYFPQEVLVISAAFARMIEFLGELAIVMVFLTLFHHSGIPVSYIFVVPLIGILFLLVIGISLLVVTFAVYYHDAVQAISLATLALFYVSPVFYNIDLIPESIRTFYLFNPMALLLNLYHDALYWGKIPDLKFFLIASGVALAFALAGYAVFNRKKREFAEIV